MGTDPNIPDGPGNPEAEDAEAQPSIAIARGDMGSRTWLILSADGEAAENLKRDLDGRSGVGPCALQNLNGQKGIETYNRDIYFLYVPCAPAQFQLLGEILRQGGIEPRTFRQDPAHAFTPSADIQKMGKWGKRFINRITNLVKDTFRGEFEGYPEFLDFKRRFKRDISRANKILLDLKSALSEEEGAPDPAAIIARVPGIGEMVAEAQTAFEAIRAEARIPPDAIEGWNTRLDRLAARHRKAAARLEQMAHEAKKRASQADPEGERPLASSPPAETMTGD